MLRDVTFSIAPGQFVGVVGPTGSGKSTIVSLIPRFYDPTAGRILIDGHRHPRLHARRPPPPDRFRAAGDGAVSRHDAREHRLWAPPARPRRRSSPPRKLANADEFIARMPHGYDTPIGERGATLSGGQRQRIGIARAFIRNAPILILDEPTASLDTESEELVMEGLDRLMKGRTVIMITHRLNTIRDCRHDHRAARGRRGGTRDARGSARARRDLCRPVPGRGRRRPNRSTSSPPIHLTTSGARMARSLIVLPDDSAKPILAAIEARRGRSASRCSSSPIRRCSRR